MGFGAELLFLFVLGFLLLGPKKLPAILGHIARAKAHIKEATNSFTTGLDGAPAPHSQPPETNVHAGTGERE